MIGIYKIENKVNDKIYIGQSENIFRRWRHHKNEAFNKGSKKYEYPLYRSFRKYGLDNFIFEVIEECNKEALNDKEKFWIKYYNSFFGGYNQTLGGDCSKREKKEKILKVFDLIENTNMIFSDIANECEISYEMVQGINTGRFWNDGRDYPIRKMKYYSDGKQSGNKKQKYCMDCHKEISHTATRCVECSHRHRNESKPGKEVLEKLIYTYPFIQIGKMFDVTDNAVRKWCKSYGLPYKKNDIKLMKEKDNSPSLF